MAAKRKPPPIYEASKMVPVTDELLRAWAERIAEPEPLPKLLDAWTRALLELIAGEGVELLAAPPALASLKRGEIMQTIAGGYARFRADEVSTEALGAMDALECIEAVRKSKGDMRVLAGFDLGASMERLRATAAWGKTIDAHKRSIGNLRNKPTVSDTQILAELAKHNTQADAAAGLGITTRQLRTRLGLMRGTKRKSDRLPPQK